MPIVLTGFEELLDSLGQIESRVERKEILAGAMRHALQPLFDRFGELAPDDPLTPGNRIQLYERKSVVDQTSSSVLGKVGDTPKGFVGYLHQWGTKYMGAHPFATQAWEDTEGEVVSILGDRLMSGIIGETPGERLDSE